MNNRALRELSYIYSSVYSVWRWGCQVANKNIFIARIKTLAKVNALK